MRKESRNTGAASGRAPVLGLVAFWLFCALAGLSGRCLASERCALVIGNDRYEPGVGVLRNSGNDARAMARVLKGLGFSVIERHDVTRDQALESLAMFRESLSGADVALFYFAGHGLAIDGQNYLVPVRSGFRQDLSDDVARRLQAETRLINAEQVVADMSSAGARCNLVILDACRNAPVARGGGTRSAVSRGGLSEMVPPAGSLIAFASDAGRVAFDGDGRHGLYTEELLVHLATPGLTIEQVFKRTRAGVLKRSGGVQLPAEYSRLVGEDVYLAGSPAVRLEPTGMSSSPPPDWNRARQAAREGRGSVLVEMLRALDEDPDRKDAAGAVELLLDRVKDDLRAASGPSSRVVEAEVSCAAVQAALPEILGVRHPRFAELAAKAANRRGDALLLLGRPREALAAFEAAHPLAPEDPFILYNRGRALLALGEHEAARRDFTAAADERFDKPLARRLAQAALAGMRGAPSVGN